MTVKQVSFEVDADPIHIQDEESSDCNINYAETSRIQLGALYIEDLISDAQVRLFVNEHIGDILSGKFKDIPDHIIISDCSSIERISKFMRLASMITV